MKMRSRVGAVIVSCGVMAGTAGVATAAPVIDQLPWPLPVIAAGSQAYPDKALARTTADGWRLHVRKTGEKLRLVRSLNRAMTTGEVFGSLNASAWIDGKGKPKIDKATFEAGYQIGCGVDVSKGADVTLAGTFGINPSTTLGVEGGPSVKAGVDAGPSVKVGLPNPEGELGADAKVNGEVGADAKVKAETTVAGTAEVSPEVTFHIDPGKVTNIALVSRPVDLKYKRAAGGFTGAHLQINGCAGPVSVRSYAQLATTSATSVDQVTVYGTPQRIR